MDVDTGPCSCGGQGLSHFMADVHEPKEPPVGAYVVDKDGVPWAHLWVEARMDPSQWRSWNGMLPWERLLARGPVRMLR